ncbi:MAG: carboxypeptidase-like regulatory domain-containing protein [Verrucomicrobiota bacterium]|nr:carboxypeptidase-like regulatory domain-containing protein [Verrucomicrobiota bacterium]
MISSVNHFSARSSVLLALLAVSVLIFVESVRADHPASALFQTAGYVRDNFGQPVTNILVYGDNFIGDIYPSITDSNGSYIVTYPADGNYRLTVDCGQLTARGYGCVGDVGIAQEGDLIEQDFVVPKLDSSLQITNSALPHGNVDMAYSVQLGATGGRPPYHWQLATDSPNLPSGLLLNSSGLLSGTPESFSSANLNLTVSDANSAFGEKTLLLVINPKPMLTLLSWVTNRFTMRLSGAPRQNYTLQVCTNLTTANWTSLIITNNPDIGTFLVRDSNATNQQSVYRILIGP